MVDVNDLESYVPADVMAGIKKHGAEWATATGSMFSELQGMQKTAGDCLSQSQGDPAKMAACQKSQDDAEFALMKKYAAMTGNPFGVMFVEGMQAVWDVLPDSWKAHGVPDEDCPNGFTRTGDPPAEEVQTWRAPDGSRNFLAWLHTYRAKWPAHPFLQAYAQIDAMQQGKVLNCYADSLSPLATLPVFLAAWNEANADQPFETIVRHLPTQGGGWAGIKPPPDDDSDNLNGRGWSWVVAQLWSAAQEATGKYVPYDGSEITLQVRKQRRGKIRLRPGVKVGAQRGAQGGVAAAAIAVPIGGGIGGALLGAFVGGPVGVAIGGAAGALAGLLATRALHSTASPAPPLAGVTIPGASITVGHPAGGQHAGK